MPAFSGRGERGISSMSELSRLRKRIATGTAIVGIYGPGYAGLPLALRFSEVGIKVIGFDIDIDIDKVDALNVGQSYIEPLSIQKNQHARRQGFDATSDFSRSGEVDALTICVPTPHNAHRKPDLSFVTNTIDAVLRYFRAGQLLSPESTTWPGTTDEELAPG